MKTFFVAAAALSIGLFGCAVETSSTDSASTSEALSQSSGLYGQSCGGFVVHPVVCVAGLECAHVDANGNPTNPDTPGICLEGVGGACGGNTTTAKKCAEGLICEGKPPVGDLGGKCVPVSEYNGPCGGLLANAAVCDAGLECSHVDANGNSINPDLAGVCLEAAGQRCGGNTTTAKKCAEGLVCKGGKLVGDVGGTCQ